jgi:hypothetical protein
MPMLKYRNENFKFGMADLKNVYQFPQKKEKMYPEIRPGKMYYRLKWS